MEDQVSQILKSIKKKEIRTNAQIRKNIEKALDDIYDDYLCYKNNEMNKKMALLDLDGFEIVELENIHKGDTIIYFRTKYFFNIAHHSGTAINILKRDRLSVRVKGDIKHIKCKYYFRKLTEEDKVKISLVEAIFDS